MICPTCREAGATESFVLAQKLHDKCPAVQKKLSSLCDCTHLILVKQTEECVDRVDC